ncbi:MAG: serine protease [Acidimicrobiales bacterium]
MRTGTLGRVTAVAAVVLGSVAGWLGITPTATSLPQWAPAASAAIHPGAVMVTDGAQCTANFVFTRGTEVFLGYAAHCAGTGGPTDTNGCEAGSLPLGTKVDIAGATRPGVLVYSSWLAMHEVGERNANACEYNDLGLVQIDPRDVGRVNPSIPHWGGPTGLNRTGNPSGSAVYSYGSSELRLGITLLSPQSGSSLGTIAGGWAHPVYTILPGLFGDSGAALLDASGRATGVLSTINLAPRPLSTTFVDLQRTLAYARMHGMGNVTLANGTQAFNANQLPLG